MARGSEFDIIERYFAPLSKAAPGAYGLANDAAVWRSADGFEAVITTDCMVAGVHFLSDDPAGSIAAKLLAVNLSDIAAMGARPAVYTLAAAWPKEIDEQWIADFAAGLGDAQTAAGVTLIGGDTVSTDGPLVLTLTAIGEAEQGKALSRSGARPGDDVYVTGTIGDAALGLLVLRGKLKPEADALRDHLICRYRAPTARSAFGAGLAGLASSAIDVSDGLAQDVGHLARESGAGITIFRDELPLSLATRSVIEADPARLQSVIGGGDDYELAFTAPPAQAEALAALAAGTTTPLTRIGTVAEAGTAGAKVRVLGDDGATIAVTVEGYRHF